jgi:hypothetical protein
MSMHANSFQSASCCESYSLTRAIFEVNATITGDGAGCALAPFVKRGYSVAR